MLRKFENSILRDFEISRFRKIITNPQPTPQKNDTNPLREWLYAAPHLAP